MGERYVYAGCVAQIFGLPRLFLCVLQFRFRFLVLHFTTNSLHRACAADGTRLWRNTSPRPPDANPSADFQSTQAIGSRQQLKGTGADRSTVIIVITYIPTHLACHPKPFFHSGRNKGLSARAPVT